jgi:tripartite ATP-independent transporter DctP family solute receptor
MAHRMTRAHFVTTAAGSTLASIGVIAAPTRAAQFEYKFAHGSPTNFSSSVRMVEAFDAVTKESNGRFVVKTFPNSVMGSELANIGQIKSNTIQFTIIPSIALSTAVPGLGMDGLGFVFRDSKAAESAYDGPMGRYLRQLIMDKGIFAFPNAMNLGMRVVTSSSRQIKSAADFAGFKIRTQPGQIAVDLFRTLGASPTPIVYPEVYLALQTHTVDGQETPYQTIEAAKFYEVQKYLSVTNHQPTIFWAIANQESFNALPSEIRQSLLKHVARAVILQRRDALLQNDAFADKLRRFGLQFNTADGDSMRANLKPFYAKWKGEFGTTAWDLLERSVGKLV